MLRVHTVTVRGYRSIRHMVFPIRELTVFVGSNGVGKTNLYRSLELLQAAAASRLTQELAIEGGMESVLWAGPRHRAEPAQVRLSVELVDDETAQAFHYQVEVGLPPPITAAAFALEPQIKREELAVRTGARAVTMLSREGPSGFVRDEDGRKRPFGITLLATETALGALQDAARFPEIQTVRQAMSGWRFHHHFRTDRVHRSAIPVSP